MGSLCVHARSVANQCDRDCTCCGLNCLEGTLVLGTLACTGWARLLSGDYLHTCAEPDQGSALTCGRSADHPLTSANVCYRSQNSLSQRLFSNTWVLAARETKTKRSTSPKFPGFSSLTASKYWKLCFVLYGSGSYAP